MLTWSPRLAVSWGCEEAEGMAHCSRGPRALQSTQGGTGPTREQTTTDHLLLLSSIDFIIGLFITLGASIVNALGLNITKLDFTRQELLPAAQRTRASTRLLWWLGLGLYIASQVVGSTLALEYLRAEWVAPLGSTSLIFNFILYVPPPPLRLSSSF